jgi:hypothetical protein
VIRSHPVMAVNIAVALPMLARQARAEPPRFDSTTTNMAPVLLARSNNFNVPAHRGKNPTPFVWKASAEVILDKVRRCKELSKTGDSTMSPPLLLFPMAPEISSTGFSTVRNRFVEVISYTVFGNIAKNREGAFR